MQPGDRLSSIASCYDAAWRDVYDANRATIAPDPDHIEVGQRLIVPGG